MKARKQFFFEKKNQKTFISVRCASLKRSLQHSRDSGAKACFFFSKKKAFLPLPYGPA